MDQSEFEQVCTPPLLKKCCAILAAQALPFARRPQNDAEICPDCDLNCAEKCARKTRAVVDAGADRISCGPTVVDFDAGFAGLIDHTLLKPEASRDEIKKLCQEATKFGFASVCTNPLGVCLWPPNYCAAPK